MPSDMARIPLVPSQYTSKVSVCVSDCAGVRRPAALTVRLERPTDNAVLTGSVMLEVVVVALRSTWLVSAAACSAMSAGCVRHKEYQHERTE